MTTLFPTAVMCSGKLWTVHYDKSSLNLAQTQPQFPHLCGRDHCEDYLRRWGRETEKEGKKDKKKEMGVMKGNSRILGSKHQDYSLDLTNHLEAESLRRVT